MKKNINGNIEFKEEQRFRQPWLWLLVIFPVLVSIGITIAVTTNSIGTQKQGILAFAMVIPMSVIIIYLFFITKFEMIVTDEAIYYRWRPFQKKLQVIAKSEIAEVKLRKSPLLHIGYKRVLGYGRVHNLGASKGLHLILKSGRKIFFSSEKINGFQRAVEKLTHVSLK